MSWYRQVKAIYTATFLVFVFICYSLAAGMILQENMDFTVYISMFGSACLMQYFKNKEKNSIIAVGVPCTIVAAINFIIFPLEPFLVRTAFNTVIILFLEKQDEEDVNYDVYKERMKKAIFLLLPIGLIAPSVKFSNIYWVYRFYMLFLIFTVITLREARNYTNKIRNKRGHLRTYLLLL